MAHEDFQPEALDRHPEPVVPPEYVTGAFIAHGYPEAMQALTEVARAIDGCTTAFTLDKNGTYIQRK